MYQCDTTNYRMIELYPPLRLKTAQMTDGEAFLQWDSSRSEFRVSKACSSRFGEREQNPRTDRKSVPSFWAELHKIQADILKQNRTTYLSIVVKLSEELWVVV